MTEWCSHRFFAYHTVILNGISSVDQGAVELVSSLKCHVLSAGGFRLSNVNNVRLLWNFLSVSPKAMHNDFLLQRLNVTFFNLSQDNSFDFRDVAIYLTKLSKKHTLQLMLNMDRPQPGRLSVQTHTYTENQPNCSKKACMKSICVICSDTTSY